MHALILLAGCQEWYPDPTKTSATSKFLFQNRTKKKAEGKELSQVHQSNAIDSLVSVLYSTHRSLTCDDHDSTPGWSTDLSASTVTGTHTVRLNSMEMTDKISQEQMLLHYTVIRIWLIRHHIFLHFPTSANNVVPSFSKLGDSYYYYYKICIAHKFKHARSFTSTYKFSFKLKVGL